MYVLETLEETFRNCKRYYKIDLRKYGVYKRDKRMNIRKIFSCFPEGVNVVIPKTSLKIHRIGIRSLCSGILRDYNSYNDLVVTCAVVLNQDETCNVYVKLGSLKGIAEEHISIEETKKSTLLIKKDALDITPVLFIVLKKYADGYLVVE